MFKNINSAIGASSLVRSYGTGRGYSSISLMLAIYLSFSNFRLLGRESDNNLSARWTTDSRFETRRQLLSIKGKAAFSLDSTIELSRQVSVVRNRMLNEILNGFFIPTFAEKIYNRIKDAKEESLYGMTLEEFRSLYYPIIQVFEKTVNLTDVPSNSEYELREKFEEAIRENADSGYWDKLEFHEIEEVMKLVSGSSSILHQVARYLAGVKGTVNRTFIHSEVVFEILMDYLLDSLVTTEETKKAFISAMLSGSLEDEVEEQTPDTLDEDAFPKDDKSEVENDSAPVLEMIDF